MNKRGRLAARAHRIVAFCMSGLLVLSSVFVGPTAAWAVDWQTYLAQQWQQCEDTFAALDRTTGLTPWDGGASQPTSGSGTAADPWLVGTPAQLSWVMHNAPATQKSLRLTSDLDMGGTAKRNWAPATGFDSGEVLIDGAGHTIYNLYVSGSGAGVTGAGLAFISAVNNPSFTMKDLTFKYAEVRSSGGTYNYAVAVGWFARGLLQNVGVEDSLVKGVNFAGGLCVGWNTSYAAVDGSGNKLANPTGSRIDGCRTVRVYTYGNSCIGNFIAPLWGGTVTNSYATGGVTVSTGGHSGGFVSCPGYCYVENCFCNITMYGNTQTGVFNGVNHFNNAFVNCGASGVVEGTDQVGGFVGCALEQASQYTNCYSTTMTGMQSSASNMGGFVGSATSTMRFSNCYAAGEVGALTTEGNAASVGGFVGTHGNATFTNCYFDKQTSAMDVRAVDTQKNIKGLLTKEMCGTGALANMPGLSSDVYMAKEGVYPQLKRFADPTEFPANNRNSMVANSMASVCTAMLYPSNGDFTDAEYDTVRKITYVFPFTNDAMVNDPNFAVSWEADKLYSTVVGNNDVPIIVLDENTYEVKSLAPGVGWTTVRAVYTNPITGEQATGSRRLRLVPTTTLSLATSRGIDHVAYVARDGARPLPVNVDEGFVSYDHRLGVNFSKGNAIQLGNGQLIQEAFPATSMEFSDVQLGTVGGLVDVLMERQLEDGAWENVELTDDVKELLLRQRHTELRDLGHYRMTYRWYTSGNKAGAYLESTKFLDVIETFDITYYKNDEDLEQPASQGEHSQVEPIAFWRAGGTGLRQALNTKKNASPYYYDIGAYLPGDTVAAAYYPGSASAAEGVPVTPATDGWRFDGWNTEADGSGDSFGPATPITKNMVLYGQWSPKPIDVVFDLDGGEMPGENEGDPASSDPIVQHSEALKTVTAPEGTPVREGYSFMGWSTEQGSLIPNFNGDEQLWEEPDDTRTYYAVWVPNPKTEVTVKTENITDPKAEHPQVDDKLVTTVTASNTGDPTSYWQGVNVSVPLPAGVDLMDEPITVERPDGTTQTLDPKDVYDPETRTVSLRIGDVPGDSQVKVHIPTKVNGKALPPKSNEPTDPSDPDDPNPTDPFDPQVDISVKVTGENPDGSPVEELQREAPTPGSEQVLPANPDPTVTKEVTNVTRGDATDAQVGDLLRYTVTVANDHPYSELKDAVASDLLPLGLDLVPDTVKVAYPDGVQEAMDPADVYHDETHTLTVPVGNIFGGEKVVVTFEAKVNRSAVDEATPEAHDIGNVATVDGNTPEDKKGEQQQSQKIFPSGWIKFAIPQPTVAKTVIDDDHPNGYYEGDQVTYSIEAGNSQPGTAWEDVVVHDTLPDGLAMVATSLTLIHPDGTQERLARDLYDPETRELTVPIGTIQGGEVWRVTFACDLSKPANGTAVVNRASASGTGFGLTDPSGDGSSGIQSGGIVAVDAAGIAEIKTVQDPYAENEANGSDLVVPVKKALRSVAVIPATGDRVVDGVLTVSLAFGAAVCATMAVLRRRRAADR